MKLNSTSINCQPFKNTTPITWIKLEMLLLCWPKMCLKFQTNGTKLHMISQPTKLNITQSNMISLKPLNHWSLTVRLETLTALCFTVTEKKPRKLQNLSIYSKTMSKTWIIFLNTGMTSSKMGHGRKNVTNISYQTVYWRERKIFLHSLSFLSITNAMRITTGL